MTVEPPADDLDVLLDRAYLKELEVGVALARALQEKAEWEAFVRAFVAAAKKAGREVALDAIPALAAALRLALAAAAL